MPRARLGAARRRRKKRVLQAARGYRGARHRLYRTAKEAVTRAGVYARRDRRARKREFRGLWITRLTAACQQRGIRYGQFVNGLKRARVAVNRKMLAEIAVADPAAFDALVRLAERELSKAVA
ncbi:MAG: 50S ribosomal protein L20 [Phycisphaerae bacterium]